MDDIFARANSILIIWADNVDPENLPVFQEIIQSKSKQADIAFENVQMLLDCKCRWYWRLFLSVGFLELSSATCNILVRPDPIRFSQQEGYSNDHRPDQWILPLTSSEWSSDHSYRECQANTSNRSFQNVWLYGLQSTRRQFVVSHR